MNFENGKNRKFNYVMQLSLVCYLFCPSVDQSPIVSMNFEYTKRFEFPSMSVRIKKKKNTSQSLSCDKLIFVVIKLIINISIQSQILE